MSLGLDLQRDPEGDRAVRADHNSMHSISSGVNTIPYNRI